MGAILFTLGAAPTIAAAAENELFVSIRYSVDDSARGCWDETEFRRRVAQRIGYDPFREEAPVSVRVHVGGASNAVDGHVEWRKSNGTLMGERRFVAKDGDCRNLLTEMSFSVGLQIELLRPKMAGDANTSSQSAPDMGAPKPPTAPSGGGPEGSSAKDATATPRPNPPPKREQAAADDRRPPDAPTAEPDAKDPTHWPGWVGIGPSLAWRLSPSITTDARLFLGMRVADFSFEIAGEATYPSTQTRWDQSGFRQALVGASVAGCGHHQWLSACGLGRASAVRVTGIGVNKPRSPTGFVAQVGLRVAATVPLGQTWFLAGHVDGLASLTPSRVELNDGIMWEMPRLGALAGIDVALFFR
jgi:hypothetical protein